MFRPFGVMLSDSVAQDKIEKKIFKRKKTERVKKEIKKLKEVIKNTASLLIVFCYGQ